MPDDIAAGSSSSQDAVCDAVKRKPPVRSVVMTNVH